MIEADLPPLRRFGKDDRVYVQAQQIWLVLSCLVMSTVQRQPDRIATITYGRLARRMDYPTRQAGRALGRQLGIIGQYCVLNKVAPLNVIVVSEATGVPGDEVVRRPGRSVDQEQAAVMREDWFSIRVPTTGTFRKVWHAMG
jgi:hypothetical protein